MEMENAITLPRKQGWSFQKAFCALAVPLSYMSDEKFGQFETHCIIKRLKGDKIQPSPLDIIREVAHYLWAKEGQKGVSPWHSIMRFKDGRWGYFTASCGKGGFEDNGKMSLTITYSFKRLILEAVPDGTYWTYYNETVEE